MDRMREELRVGLDYLESATVLLQRIRRSHPTAGLYEAADLQWWWGQRSRSTDETPQLFWFDEDDRPGAAVIATAAADRMQLDPLVLPDATPEWVRHVMSRGLSHASEFGFDNVGLEVARTDAVLRQVLADFGFACMEEGVVEAWLPIGRRPAVSELAPGYRSSTRADSSGGSHHMTSAKRQHPDPEARLRQTSLYRPDLDLVVYDSADEVAAYGLFWYDPESATGLVEPMRTEDEHQRRGLARHILTAGLVRLAEAGAERVKICFEADNPASEHLYLSVGFEPDRQTDVFAGRTYDAHEKMSG